MKKVVELNINNLIQDDLNANKGTEQGKILINKSLTDLGAGRSVLVDKNNKIIAGNKTALSAIEAGIKDVLIIDTDGTQLVAVRRKDIDIDSEKGRQLAIADNATAAANLEWNSEHLQVIEKEWNIDPQSWGIYVSQNGENDPDKEFNDLGDFLFVNKDNTAWKQLIVNFATKEDYEKFVMVTGLKLTENTRSTFFPIQEKEKVKDIYELPE